MRKRQRLSQAGKAVSALLPNPAFKRTSLPQALQLCSFDFAWRQSRRLILR
jgi:hypothetical protein